MDVPVVVQSSGLYSKLSENPELLIAVQSLRTVVGKLAETISRTVPTFTDHSLRHMDALWGVADRVLTQSEMSSLTLGEAFVLACTFYLHDIGMAYVATDEGLAAVKASRVYSEFVACGPLSEQSDPAFLARATAFATRRLHAVAGRKLSKERVPGTEVYLFESQSIREAWGDTCGAVAASHHTGLEEIEQSFGSQGVVPLPRGQRGDLAFVASVLRIVDYAHINRDRASTIDRAFRPPIERKSLIHWLAQEQIDGPERDGSELVYRAALPIRDVDAWWLYYEMLKGLDAEIRAVRRYLDRRQESRARLSLQGVRGAGSPEEAAVFVPTDGFLPIEINVRTGSIEKLVELLAGESLYGPDPMTAVRELIQNARDAVMLKFATATDDVDRASLNIPIRLSLKTTNGTPYLEVTDYGVGMTKKVMTDYLVSVASDYWTSQFHVDFPTAVAQGFTPAGRFGIGFLSVFMLGDEVALESNRVGEERYRLRLVGVGRRGEIRNIRTQAGSGTRVRVELQESVLETLKTLPDLVRVYAPMLPHALEVHVDGQQTSIPKGWIRDLSADDFHSWILDAIVRIRRNRAGRNRDRDDFFLMRSLIEFSADLQASKRTRTWPSDWPEYSDTYVRLLASLEGMSLLCLKGLAIQPIATRGFVGIIDLESAMPDVSRRRVINADVTQVLERAKIATRPQIVKNLCALTSEGLLIEKLGFLATCVSLYGREVVLDASLPWISVLRLPGEVELASCTLMFEKLTKTNSFFVAYGTGPWTAMKKWGALGPITNPSEVAVVLDDVSPDRLPYHSSSEERVGTLSTIWPDCGKTTLFGTILHIVGNAWQVSPEELCGQEGWHHSGSTVWGRFSRP